ncbi:MAG: InlB B-repeat-containing protein [Bacilli bacterium]|nr:InlB B-repeat-containing protein [Bacilli bacterium]
MKVEDMIENYLLSMGQKINLENYTFIPKRDYDYKSKIKEETIKIGKYTIELSKINRNSKEFSNILYNARNNFNNSVSVSEDVTASCKNIVNNAIIYFTDFIKYAYNNFDLTQEVAEKFITLCNGAIDTLGRDIQSTLSEYNIKMAEAQREGAMEAQESLISSLADIDSKKSTYVTLDSYNDPIYGERVTGYVSQGFSDKAYHEGMVAGARHAASLIGSIPVDIANKKAVEGLKKLRNKTVVNFNNNFEDLLSAKIKNLICVDYIDKTGNDLNDNPLIYSHYCAVIPDLKEEDLENFDKAIKFFDFELDENLQNEALENLMNYYAKYNSFEYDGGDVKLVIYLKNDKYIFRNQILTRILEVTKSKFQNASKEDINNILDVSLKAIESCKYIKEEDIEKIKPECKELAEKIIKSKIAEVKEKKILLILNIVTTIVLILLAIMSISVASKFWYIISSNGLMMLISVALLVGFIILFRKNFKLRNKIVKILIIVVSIVLSIYGMISLNKINEFRKDKILITYYYGDETFEWVEKGTPIDLTFPEKYIGDEGAQGWTNKEGKFYLNGSVATENTTVNFSEAQGTVANGFATITFKLGNGQPDFIYKQYIGSWINVPQDPIKEGYTFVGWVQQNSNKEVVHKQNIAEGNMTIVAKYEKNK